MAALANTRSKCLLFSLSRTGKNFPRLYAVNSECVKQQQRYKESVLLPKTKFPTWIKSEKRIETDNYLSEKCGFGELYNWQRENLQGPDFILHDGPPYANGVPHMGHAINKILKDITLRSRVIRGQRTLYIPGWDCHGLPIELKALATLKEDKTKMTPLRIRHLAREYARNAVELQREAFASWGIMADWRESGCYVTNGVSYVTNQLRRFYEMYEKKLVYRDFKPVHWSPSSRTALAESELEYNDHHKSLCAIVRFLIVEAPSALREFGDKKIYGIAWTTTPWTLVANQALAYSTETVYSILKDQAENIYIVAKETLPNIEEKIGPLERLFDIKGSELSGATYRQPMTGKILPFLSASHVKTNVGTGLVHTAPAHGSEDFLLCLENKIPVISLVNKEGCYTSDAGDNFAGLEVLTKGNDAVIKFMGDDVLHTENLEHSYPYDWRTKKPVITMASHQWFIDTDSLKEKAIESLERVDIFPMSQRTSSARALYQQVKQRPYWCISRQRAWGTPIPVFYHKHSGEIVINRKIVERLCNLMTKHGTDCWWTMSIKELLGDALEGESKIDPNDLERGQDIMDIWLDSGLSWSAVLPEGTKADLYIEGIDQFTGWFQSSLLTSIALQGAPPFKALFAHGFAVDENREKMSKSQGNVVNPEDVIKGRRKNDPAKGVDVLRWWVASHGCQHTQVPVGETLIRESAESIQRLRSVLRFLLGALYRYDAPDDQVQPRYLKLDKFMLHRLYHYNKEIQSFYDDYRYNSVCRAILNFVANDVSAVYCHLVKDRLYCDEVTSPSRVGAIQVIGEMLAVLVRSLAPILPHLAEETWLYHPDNLASVPLHHSAHVLPDNWHDPEVEKIIEQALLLKTELNALVKSDTWKSEAIIATNSERLALLSPLQPQETCSDSELCEILQVSSITLIKDDSCENFDIRLNPVKSKLCNRCRRFPESEPGASCDRCAQILDALS